MFLLVVILAALVAFTVIVAMSNDDLEDEIHCQDDVPCQECGVCYSGHPGSAFASHSYVYPR